MAQKKVYDKEFEIQTVKLDRDIDLSKAAKQRTGKGTCPVKRGK